eukprot:TRINITY_DN8583_c0_g2_i1.p1 TRINITY_DN8583_c0_g2~~TRINITY_DN8583_c0_g2_i1.p1  ORF type:complete len:653 (-),score=102.99 TRINITY_DN8583_c0_g2_i1:98-1933(-)
MLLQEGGLTHRSSTVKEEIEKDLRLISNDPFVFTSGSSTPSILHRFSEDSDRIHFEGNVWHKERGESVSNLDVMDSIPIPTSTESEILLESNSKVDTHRTTSTVPTFRRFLGFYPQLFFLTFSLATFGYWWVVSPYTDGIRWLIIPILNLPVLMYLMSIYIFHYIYYAGVPPSIPSPNHLPTEAEACQLALFRWFPELRHKIAWVRLLDTPRSPITKHSINLNLYKSETAPTVATTIIIYLKREDLNSLTYSGVKPRTLEFLLASCEANHYHKKKNGIVNTDHCTLYAMGAPGSNQSAATFSHAHKVRGVVPGMLAAVPQPPTACNCLSFLVTLSSPGDIRIFFNRHFALYGFLKMLLTVLSSHFRQDVYFQYPGGATPLGAVGHMSAGLELAESVELKELPDPTHLFIAYGSGCTTAGIVVGIAMARTLRRGFRRKLEEFTLHSILVHHDYPQWWGMWWIKRLALDTAKLLKECGAPDIKQEVLRVVSRVRIHANYSNPGYGEPSTNGATAVKAFTEAVPAFHGLDPTYSAKAAACMLTVLSQQKAEEPETEMVPVFWSSKTSQHFIDKEKVTNYLPSLNPVYKDWVVASCFGGPPHWSAPEPVLSVVKC